MIQDEAAMGRFSLTMGQQTKTYLPKKGLSVQSALHLLTKPRYFRQKMGTEWTKRKTGEWGRGAELLQALLPELCVFAGEGGELLGKWGMPPSLHVSPIPQLVHTFSITPPPHPTPPHPTPSPVPHIAHCPMLFLLLLHDQEQSFSGSVPIVHEYAVPAV